MNVFTVALYNLMTKENFDGARTPLRDFLHEIIRSGKLKAGNAKPILDIKIHVEFHFEQNLKL